MQTADEVGVLLSEVSKRTVGERHDRRETLVGGWVCSWIVADDWVESEAIKVGDQRFERRRCVPVTRCPITTFVISNSLGVVWRGLQPLGHRQHHPGEHRHRGRFEPERRGVGRNRVTMLRTANIAAPDDLDRQQADVTHPFEVRPDRVRVQRERFRDLCGGLGRRRSGELKIDGVARVVAQGLEQIELRRGHMTRLHGRGR